MCGWCWGFRPTWQKVIKNLPVDIQVKYLLGGLAPDSDELMPESMQADIAGYWHKIQAHIPGTQFNFNFWEECQPRRSTYPACRAVIAARKQSVSTETKMIKAIQNAYYLEAKNPSDDSTLISLAGSLGLDKQLFSSDLNAKKTQLELEQEIAFSQQIGARGFPSLILDIGSDAEYKYHYIPLDYNNPETILSFIKKNIQK